MNILVTLDRNYLTPLTVMLHSLLRSQPNTVFDLYVAHASLQTDDFRKIISVTGSRCRLHPIHMNNTLPENAPVLQRITKETYYRLLAPDFLPKTMERILYIDPDTLVLHSLQRFYDMDLSGKCLAGCGHTHGIAEQFNRLRLKMPKQSQYINAGILLMNLTEIRKRYSAEKIFNYIEKNARKLLLADQDVINVFYADSTAYLSPTIYNMDEKTLFYSHKSLSWTENYSAIIHYNGKYKPWKPKYRGRMAYLWEREKNAVSAEEKYRTMAIGEAL